MVTKNVREGIPLPLLTGKWLSQRFPEMGRIRVVEGLGEQWKRRKLNSIVVVAFHADLEVAQLKHFVPLFFLKELIDSGYSINPVVYIGALRDIGRGYHRGDIRERVAEAHKFFQGVFSPSARSVIVEDRVEIQRDVYSILTILDFEKSLQNILPQINTRRKLLEVKTVRLTEKAYTLSAYEKELLEIYLFDRNKLRTEIKRYPYVSWGLESLGYLGAAYNIFDKSNAGLSILKKLICADQGIDYPATIVLPDPVTISGKPMRYLEAKDLNPDEALFIVDSYRDVSRKLYEQENVSYKFLDYIVRNVIRPFAPTAIQKDVEPCWEKLVKNRHMDDEMASREQKRLALKCYWEFIKTYYDSIEMILGTHESLFVPEELTQKTLDALGSKRNRQILIELASHYQKHASSMTVGELFEKMGLKKGAKKGLWRNLETLVRCGLVDRIPEGRKLHKYSIYGNKTTIRIRWPLAEMRRERPQK
ncbi:MAG: winged helix-turn-helix transcriptional regulator [Candidatus Bathyarchaeum sp.]|nr:MAG: winged helix-turn-helix transcriptional regulator [Candidatus Bathyarchaeum sp.]